MPLFKSLMILINDVAKYWYEYCFDSLVMSCQDGGFSVRHNAMCTVRCDCYCIHK
jgi:hypothetical protein